MLYCQNLTITHRSDGRALIRDFTFSPRAGEHLAVIGEEGNGKSTLIRAFHDPALISAYAAVSGTITKLAGMPVYEYLENALSGVRLEVGELSRLSRDMGIPFDSLYADRPLGSFSGGEQVKLRLLRMLADMPDLILLDEPSNDLDLPALVWLEEWIAARRETVIFISHDETLLENCADSILHLEQVMRKTEPRWTLSRSGGRTSSVVPLPRRRTTGRPSRRRWSATAISTSGSITNRTRSRGRIPPAEDCLKRRCTPSRR